MVQWPEGKSIVLAFIVAWETWPESLGTARSHQNSSQRPNPKDALYDWDMWAVYDHMYGETQGLPRLLDVFDKHEVKATFVPNGRRLLESPELARDAAKRGHDFGSENFVHEYAIMYTEEQERKDLTDTVNASKEVVGSAPTGYISPGHRPSPNTIKILFDLGYRWDADFQKDDIPFLIRDGERTMVGMPYAHISDYLTYNRQGRTPREILEMLIDEFNILREEGQNGSPKMMGYAIHPFLCHPHRTMIVDELLKHAKQFDDVWIPTRNEITDWVLENPQHFEERTLDEVMADFPTPQEQGSS